MEGSASPQFTARLMPLAFNVYSESATSGAVYYMGPHQKDRQYALTIEKSLGGASQPFLILHDGLLKEDPAMGSVRNAWTKGATHLFDQYVISAPILDGSQAVEERLFSVDKGTELHPVIMMRYSAPVTAAAAVPAGGDVGAGFEMREFEWQESSCREVTRLGGESRGWRLVAVADESETLAVCAPNGNSLTKFLRFSFLGKGKTTDFGSTWEVMAVLTGLTTWNRKVEIMNSMG